MLMNWIGSCNSVIIRYQGVIVDHCLFAVKADSHASNGRLFLHQRHSGASPPRHLIIKVRHGLLFITAVVLVFVWANYIFLPNDIPVQIVPTYPIQIASDLTTVLTPLVLQNHDAQMDDANAIVKRAYERTYGKILPCDNDMNGEDCITKTMTHFKPPIKKDEKNLPSLQTSIPWWFQTLLRDLPGSGVYAGWSMMNSVSPPIQFCGIPKIGSSQWNKLFCILNDDRNKISDCNSEKGENDDDGWNCWAKCIYTTAEEGTLPEDAPKVVFLRDPLERLLSAYLNKCEDTFFRLGEKHCEPVEIFGRQYNETDLFGHIEDSHQQMFAAYLDIMPLRWNLHVIPQAFSCDLYRQIKNYDFVGIMNEDFKSDLDKIARHFGGPFPDLLNRFFPDKNHTATQIRYTSHNTEAREKVIQYYTPQSLRRALEYVSIDYVVLGLNVPEWAIQMLKEDSI